MRGAEAIEIVDELWLVQKAANKKAQSILNYQFVLEDHVIFGQDLADQGQDFLH